MDLYLKRTEIGAMVAAALDGGGAASPRTSLDECFPGGKPSAVLAVACSHELIDGLRALLAQNGHAVIRSPRLIDVQTRQWMSGTWKLHHISHLLVDIAALGGFARCRQDLRRIKDVMPDLPCILIDDDRAFDQENVGRKLFPDLPSGLQRPQAP